MAAQAQNSGGCYIASNGDYICQNYQAPARPNTPVHAPLPTYNGPMYVPQKIPNAQATTQRSMNLIMQLHNNLAEAKAQAAAQLAPADASEFGPPSGCTAAGPGDVVVGPGTNLQAALNTLPAGKTLLLKAGSYTANNLNIPDGRTISALGGSRGACEKVTLKLSGAMRPGSNTAIRGLTITGGSDQIRVDGGARNVLIENNNFQNSGRWCIAVRGNATDNVMIRGNTFTNCADDVIQAENHSNLTITGNIFNGNVSDQIIDLKVARGPSTVSNNIFHCASKTGAACVLYHANDYPPPAGPQHTFTGNTVNGCGGNGKWLHMGGNKRYNYRNLKVTNNTFAGTGCRVVFGNCTNCTLENNQRVK